MIDYAVEAIDYMGQDLLYKLTNVVKFLRSNGNYDTKAINDSKFSQIVNQHTGMKVDILIPPIQEFTAYTLLPDYDKNHPFVRYFANTAVHHETSGQKVLSMLREDAMGTVNLATGKVGGLYSNVPLELVISKSVFENTAFTAEEIASIILHELGHLFTYFEYIGTLVRGGLVTAVAARLITDTASLSERKDIIRNAEKILGVESIYSPAIATSTNPGKVHMVLFRNYLAKQVSGTLTSVYDLRNCEQVADLFATRHGAGRHLVTALDKTFKYYGSQRDNIFTFIVHNIVLVISALMLTIALPFFGVIAVVLLTYPPTFRIYDDEKDRLQFIRNQVVDNINMVKRRKPVDTKYLRQLVDDVEKIDEIISGFQGRRRDIFTVFWQSMPGGARNLREQEKAAKKLEQLLFNDLTYQASRFELLDNKD